MSLRVITAVYGESHLLYLRALVESLRRLGIVRPIVVHAEVPLLALMGAVRYEATFVPLETITLGNVRQFRVARKLVAWEAGLTECEDGDHVTFLDADTIVLRPLEDAFAGDFDLAYTVRPGRWPINSGVVFARCSAQVREFVAYWRDLTEWLLTHGDRVTLATARHGAADQAALAMAVALFGTGCEPLRIATLPCEMWNETQCRRDLENVGIAHLKGCAPLMLRQRPYGPEYGDERCPSECEPLFALWRELAGVTTES